MNRKVQKAVAGIVAAIAAIYGTTMLWSVGYSAWLMANSGSGGIGGVSSGLIEALVPLTCAVTNRVLVRWARRAGGVILALHRAHSIMLLFLAVLVVLSVVLLAGLAGVHLDVRLWVATGLLAGFTLAAQSLLLAAILTVFATQETGFSAVT